MNNKRTASTEQDPLVRKFTAHLDGLEKKVNTVRAADAEKVERAKKNLAPSLDRAALLKGDYEVLRDRFAPVLTRMESLDMERIRTFPGHNKLGNVKEDAKRLREAFTQAIAELTSLIARAKNVTIEDCMAGVASDIHEHIGTHVGGPERLMEKVTQLLARVESFEVSQVL
jgi:hypothetical protein